MKTFKQLSQHLSEAIVHVKSVKQSSNTTVHAGVDYRFAERNKQDPYFSVTHDETKGHRWVSGGIASPHHVKAVGNEPEDRTDLMKVQRMHLRSATTGEPMHGRENAYFHAGIGKYAPEGGNHEHLAHHLGISHEHANEIISQVHSTQDDSAKKAIVDGHYEALKPKFKQDCDEAHAAIARLAKKYPATESN